DDVHVASVVAAEAVLVVPAVRRTAERFLDAVLHARAVLRMDLLEPPADVGSDRLARVPEAQVHPVAPLETIRDHVPVPDRVVDRARREAVARLARAQTTLGPAQVGDVVV